ncbi:hypothetical protein HDU93_002550 [Gonapodya sp. JEL0774]|nr:hypothetical protein HDU93_002550 [Gonapodya sp. JEL0774]
MSTDDASTPLLAEARETGTHVVEGARSLFQEFKAFIVRGNVADLAIAVIIGAAFSRVVDSAVTDLFTPFVALFTQHSSLPDANLVLRPGKSGKTNYPTLEEARRDEAVSCRIGGNCLVARKRARGSSVVLTYGAP